MTRKLAPVRLAAALALVTVHGTHLASLCDAAAFTPPPPPLPPIADRLRRIQTFTELRGSFKSNDKALEHEKTPYCQVPHRPRRRRHLQQQDTTLHDTCVSARQARIRTPLSTLSSIVLSSAISKPAAYGSDLDGVSSFYSTLRQYYPDALPSTALADKVLATLIERSYRQADYVLIGSSLCNDGGASTSVTGSEVYDRISSGLNVDRSGGNNKPIPPQGVTNLAGVAGIPFAGPSGFDTFFSYVPSGSGGKVFIMYGPSVALTEDGVMGPLSSDSGSRTGEGGCNAIVEAYNSLRDETKGQTTSPSLGGVKQIEQAYLVKELRKRLPRLNLASIADSDQGGQTGAFAKFTYATYDIISDLLLKEVENTMQTKKATFWDDVSEIVMLGGITILQQGGRTNFGEYFKPIIFQSMTKTPGQTFVVTDNLFGSLVDGGERKTSSSSGGGGNVALVGKKRAENTPNVDFDLSSMIVDARKVDGGSAPAPPLPPLPSEGAAAVSIPDFDFDIDITEESIKKGAAAFGGAAVVGGIIAAWGSDKDMSPGPAPASEQQELAPNTSRDQTYGTTVRLPTTKAPEGMPTLINWRRNANDGSISGNIYGAPNYLDGSYITTSPIQGTPYSGAVAESSSGSRYYLGATPKPGMALMTGKKILTSSKPRTTASLETGTPVSPVPSSVQEQKSSGFLGLAFGRNNLPLPSNPATSSIIASLIQAVAATDRGQLASRAQRGNAASLIMGLEALSPIKTPTETPRIEGTWELLYTDGSLLLTSPFFLSRCSLCDNTRELAKFKKSLNNLQKSSILEDIGSVREIVTERSVVSEIDIASEGTIVTKATIQPTLSGTAWEVSASSTELRGSNVSVDLVRQLLDIKTGASVSGGDLVPGTVATLRTTYLDDSIRVSRDTSGTAFVFKKVSGSTRPKQYSRRKGKSTKPIKIL
eukprot:CAMPEP_0178485294 /NCGR_PEP_ID=MMETSP0696-20121128/8201_1 /TAXON_ID=265572 /ORGANISM="Extubocellulus spinifer, Strain CCMP396" /LENGTH=933 /DNA_ID=CAMNT_0020112889 /DNA_START=268 /DNA_END=3069 /DNA_ORIENTATION=-